MGRDFTNRYVPIQVYVREHIKKGKRGEERWMEEGIEKYRLYNLPDLDFSSSWFGKTGGV